ncbi:MAG: ATP-binding protein [Candidatus Omnitrophota bacterium]
MKINVKSREPVLILALNGELILSNRESAKEELEMYLQLNKNIVIDGRALTYVDSSGLGLFLEINNGLKQKGLKSLAFTNLAPVVRKSLEVTHLVQLMPIYNYESEAVDGFTPSWNWQIPSNLVYVKAVSNKVLESLSALNLEDYFFTEIRLCTEEAVINAIKHGNNQKSQQIVTVIYKLEDYRLTISVTDEGEGFDTATRSKGLSLIFNFMDEVKFNEKGNTIVMIKKISAS